MWWTYYIFVMILARDGLALNILVIFSTPLRSHYLAFKPLLHEYATRGHSVTVMNNFPEENPPQNMMFIDLQLAKLLDFAPLEDFFETFRHPRHLNYIIDWNILPEQINTTCKNLLTNQNARVHLAKGVKYDVVIVEQFWTSDCELVYAATSFDAPIIGITSHVLLPTAYPRLGIPFNPAADQYYYSIGGPNPSFFYKMEAALGHVYLNTLSKWKSQSVVYECFQRHMPQLSFDIDLIARERIKMMFVSQHHSVTGARLSSPRLLEIGGVHVPKAKPVTEDIEKFLSTAEHGVVYVSFGSNLKASTMSAAKREHFLAAFKSIPQKVLLKWEGDFPAGHDNILARKWFSQVDVLCHPKVLAFVSHGGMLSVSETAHCGKPILAVPFFGDQFSNAAAVRSSGLGKMLYFQDITAETLASAIRELTSPEMQQSAQRVSKLWHDRPQSALDSAIYWTEYVARHRSAPPSLPSTHTTWFESMLLDVYTVLIAIILLLYWICYLIYKLIRLIICRVICKRFCRQKIKRN